MILVGIFPASVDHFFTSYITTAANVFFLSSRNEVSGVAYVYSTTSTIPLIGGLSSGTTVKPTLHTNCCYAHVRVWVSSAKLWVGKVPYMYMYMYVCMYIYIYKGNIYLRRKSAKWVIPVVLGGVHYPGIVSGWVHASDFNSRLVQLKLGWWADRMVESH